MWFSVMFFVFADDILSFVRLSPRAKHFKSMFLNKTYDFTDNITINLLFSPGIRIFEDVFRHEIAKCES